MELNPVPAEVAAAEAAGARGDDDTAPRLPFGAVLGVVVLTGIASVYLSYGLLAFPKQEWIIEALVETLFLMPVLNLLRGGSSLSTAVRLVGAALVFHSFWDAAHWPGFALVHTPIDPRIPEVCPAIDLTLGIWLLLRGR